MDTKGLRLEIKDADRGEVRAVFATMNVIDSHGDVTLPGAFEDGASVVISAYGHTSWEGRLPVGKGTIRQTSTEAIFEGQFFLNTVQGRDTFTVVKELGGLQEWSYGFDVVKESYGEHGDRQVRFLEKLRTYEVSPVLLGAGVGTRTLAVKHGTGPRDGLDEVTRAQLRNLHAQIERDMEREYGRTVLMDAAMKHLATWYVELVDGEVPEWKRVIASTALAKHCEVLNHRPLPTLRWFRDEETAEAHYLEIYGEPARKGFGWIGEGRLVGKAMPSLNEVWLNVSMHQAADIDAITGHEVRHLTGGDEDQAQAYEVLARAQYWDTEGVK